MGSCYWTRHELENLRKISAKYGDHLNLTSSMKSRFEGSLIRIGGETGVESSFARGASETTPDSVSLFVHGVNIGTVVLEMVYFKHRQIPMSATSRRIKKLRLANSLSAIIGPRRGDRRLGWDSASSSSFRPRKLQRRDCGPAK